MQVSVPHAVHTRGDERVRLRRVGPQCCSKRNRTRQAPTRSSAPSSITPRSNAMPSAGSPMRLPSSRLRTLSLLSYTSKWALLAPASPPAGRLSARQRKTRRGRLAEIEGGGRWRRRGDAGRSDPKSPKSTAAPISIEVPRLGRPRAAGRASINRCPCLTKSAFHRRPLMPRSKTSCSTYCAWSTSALS